MISSSTSRYSSKGNEITQKVICTLMFIAASFIEAKTWKQSILSVPSLAEWVKRSCGMCVYTHTHTRTVE